ncbi:MAG TPA: NAD-binding protein [Gallionella sp.]|nr:NAD-binding protein [Gallionella sp.]
MISRRLDRTGTPDYDVIVEPGSPVIIAGFGRVGQIVSRVLRMCGIPFTAIEVNCQQVDFVRRFGSKIYFGDATRLAAEQLKSLFQADTVTCCCKVPEQPSPRTNDKPLALEIPIFSVPAARTNFALCYALRVWFIMVFNEVLTLLSVAGYPTRTGGPGCE